MIAPVMLENVWPRGPQADAVPATEHMILRCAIEMFGRRGFGGTSTRAIAHAAEVTAPLIGYHFGNKEGLFRRCVEVVMAGLTATVLEDCGQGAGLRSSIHGFVRAHQHFAERYPEAIRFVLGVVYGPEEGQPRVDCMGGYLGVWKWAERTIDAAIERGEFVPRPGATSAGLLRHLLAVVHVEVFASRERTRLAGSTNASCEGPAVPTADPITEIVDQFFSGAGEIRGSNRNQWESS